MQKPRLTEKVMRGLGCMVGETAAGDVADYYRESAGDVSRAIQWYYAMREYRDALAKKRREKR